MENTAIRNLGEAAASLELTPKRFLRLAESAGHPITLSDGQVRHRITNDQIKMVSTRRSLEAKEAKAPAEQTPSACAVSAPSCTGTT